MVWAERGRESVSVEELTDTLLMHAYKYTIIYSHTTYTCLQATCTDAHTHARNVKVEKRKVRKNGELRDSGHAGTRD